MLAPRLAALSVAAAALVIGARAAVPVIDPVTPINPKADALDRSTVPVGKMVVIPITATDADGHRLYYRVTSVDRINVRARVRTGYPKLTLNIDHAAGADATDVAFSGSMEFLLLRDFAPNASDYIGGFAQACYYDNQIFHRIVDLNPTEDADGSYIFQAGDPQGTNPATAGSGGPGFSFDNEFHPGVIFSGRGQLAMANSGSNSTTFRGSNGSQFFITAGHPRFLDFNHTIFGQMVRGWEFLSKLSKVSTHPGPPSGTAPSAANPPQGYPKSAVKITSATVQPNFSDALLLVSATAPGDAAIGIEVSDGNGGVATRFVLVRAVVDETNDPPFIVQVPDQTVALNKISRTPLKFVDLERDYVFLSNRALSGSAGQAGGSNPALTLAANPGTTFVGSSATQYDMTVRTGFDSARSTDDQMGFAVTATNRPLSATAVDIGGAPAVSLANVVTARFTDSDGLAQGSGYTAKLNWGDGTPISIGTIARDPASPSPSAFVVTGTHTYAKAGNYLVRVEITNTLGKRAILTSTASINDTSVHVFGRSFSSREKLANGIIATFRDDNPLPVSSYLPTISWGDGTHTGATIRKSPSGEYQILGTHQFPDPQEYNISIRVNRNGGDPTKDVWAWSRVTASGFVKAAHMPPFTMANLIGQFSANGDKEVRSTVGGQTFASGQLIVLNAGNRTSSKCKVQFYLSEDSKLNLQDETGPDPDNAGQTIVTNAKDKLIRIGSSLQDSITLNALNAGGGIKIVLDQIAAQPGANLPPGSEFIPGMPTSNGTPARDDRLRFPAGDNGAGLCILVHLSYTDPVSDNLPIDRDIVFGPFDPFIVSPTTLAVKEADGANASKVFKVRLARKPSADVTIPITLNATATAQITTDKQSLIFTPANWNTDQEVVVTAKDDGVKESTRSVSVTLGRATSKDNRFNLFDPTDVTVSISDADPVLVTPTSLTVQEAAGDNATKVFKVRLGIKPTANVTIPITLDTVAQAEVTADKTSLIFDATNWNVEQQVTITAKDDGVADGTKTVTIVLGATTSTDTNLNAKDPPDVKVIVQDKAPATP